MDSTINVTTAASDLALLTLAELRGAAGVADNSRDADLTVLGRRVSATIARSCRVATAEATPPTLRLETLTETFRLDRCQRRLIMARRPIVEVNSIVEDGGPLGSEDYEIHAGGGMLARLDCDGVSMWPARKVVVVYRAGYEAVPDDLRLAAVKLASVFWHEGSRDPNLRRVSVEGVSEREYWVSPADDPLVPAEVMELLSPYMNYSLG